MKCQDKRFVLFLIAVQSLVFLGLGSDIQGDTRELVAVPGAKGLYRKVIVQAENAKLKLPDGTETPVQPFSIFFQVKTADGQDKNGDVLCVGDNDGEYLGDIAEADVIKWDTRYLLKPNPPQGDLKFTIEGPGYSATYHGGGGLEKQTVAPILREPEEGKNPKYEVAFFAGKVENVGGKGVAERESVKTENTKLEIMYVIDTTASMTPLIDGTKEVARRSVEELAGNSEARAAVRFGLVQYRDSTPDLGFIAKLETPLTDAATFANRLQPLAAASLGSEETSEDVLAGLLTAIEKAGWSANSSKHIILLGDASAHLSGPKNTTGLSIESLLSRAQQSAGGELKMQLESVFIHAVRAIQPGDPDGPLCAEQFRKLSLNQQRFEGFYTDLDPTNSQNVGDVVRQLVEFFRKGFAGAKALRAGDTEELEKLAEAGGATGQLVQAQYRIAVAAGGPPVKTVERGMAFIRSQDGDLLAQQSVLVSEDDLSRIESTLNLLRQGLSKRVEPAKRGDVTAFVDALKMTLAAATAGQELDPETSLEDFVGLLPLKTDALRIKPVDLARKSAEDFEKWLESLKSAQERASDLLKEQAKNWVTLSEKAANKKFAYVLVDDMP